jgi:hypothetical protein
LNLQSWAADSFSRPFFLSRQLATLLIALALLRFTYEQYRDWANKRVRHLQITRLIAGQCPTCGYDMRATPARCPECGEVALDVIAPRTVEPNRRLRNRAQLKPRRVRRVFAD